MNVLRLLLDLFELMELFWRPMIAAGLVLTIPALWLMFGESDAHPRR